MPGRCGDLNHHHHHPPPLVAPRIVPLAPTLCDRGPGQLTTVSGDQRAYQPCSSLRLPPEILLKLKTAALLEAVRPGLWLFPAPAEET